MTRRRADALGHLVCIDPRGSAFQTVQICAAGKDFRTTGRNSIGVAELTTFRFTGGSVWKSK
jgi:hypothetical protein